MKRLIIPLGAIALAIAFGSTASVMAQTAPQPQPPAATQPPTAPDHGPMGGMGMKEGMGKEGMGMMGMMQRMSRMMDQCERMMQEREQRPNQPDRPPG